jgi:hypothetical protein
LLRFLLPDEGALYAARDEAGENKAWQASTIFMNLDVERSLSFRREHTRKFAVYPAKTTTGDVTLRQKLR